VGRLAAALEVVALDHHSVWGRLPLNLLELRHWPSCPLGDPARGRLFVLARLEELARLQAAFREVAYSNPEFASGLAHRFERQVRFERGLVVL
jgi:hypothetical protein